MMIGYYVIVLEKQLHNTKAKNKLKFQERNYINTKI